MAMFPGIALLGVVSNGVQTLGTGYSSRTVKLCLLQVEVEAQGIITQLTPHSLKFLVAILGYQASIQEDLELLKGPSHSGSNPSIRPEKPMAALALVVFLQRDCYMPGLI
ncbi:hypothetical protein DSO57_1015670 [Entomophthora muscae]|uniref:Uncharacterized protein n=1 Tax=Entomophthora muscae TaxID=34485 RepID=A0ACC2UR60_9FUNG|nr:hypothetical protein DSO57_1015670 [Entomophthora muscae]